MTADVVDVVGLLVVVGQVVAVVAKLCSGAVVVKISFSVAKSISGHHLLVLDVVVLLRLGRLRLGCLGAVFLDLVLDPMLSDPYVTKVRTRSMIVC